MKKEIIPYAPGHFQGVDIAAITAAFKPMKLGSSKYLLSEGEVCNTLYWVRRGNIRTFFVDKQGVEKTSSVMVDQQFGTEWTSFISRQPSLQFIEAAEGSELSILRYKDFQQRVHGGDDWKEFYLRCLEMAFLSQSRKVEALMVLDARQRYEKLLKGNPALIQKLSNKTLASFLDMREETLSRVKSRK